VVAWSDETHVERARASYAAKRDVMVSALARSGMRVAGGNASMYVWVAVRAGERSEELAARLLEHGILVAPGSYLGAAGEGYVRIALVPTLAECQRAAALLGDAL
jgi:acetylornithine aminotransferase